MLKRVDAGEKLSNAELCRPRMYMRDSNIILDIKRDIIEGISILNGRVRVYGRKLSSREKKVSPRRQPPILTLQRLFL